MDRHEMNIEGRRHPNRRTIRLRGYDYARPGAYFVTVCVQNLACLFGDIVDGEMVLNDAGMMVHSVWSEIPSHYPGIEIDTFVVIPNHIHGIIKITAAGVNGQPRGVNGQPQGVAPTVVGVTGEPRGVGRTGLSLPDAVHRFKTMTTKRYVDGVKQYGWRRFKRKLWQRNYYERVIRNDDELNRIREYIVGNPAQWVLDP